MLVVDDNALVTDALGVLLDLSGYRVRIADSVAGALQAAREEMPDAALVDITLQDGDGLEIVRALAASDHPPRAIAALTGHDDPETEARCVEAGCRAVLVKPILPRQLVASLREWLGA